MLWLARHRKLQLRNKSWTAPNLHATYGLPRVAILTDPAGRGDFHYVGMGFAVPNTVAFFQRGARGI